MVTSATSNVRTIEDLNNRSVDSQLGKDEFMKILVSQLSNQDPLEPTSDTDFIAQLAQFSMLEQMQSLNSGFLTSQAYSLIGKQVYVSKPIDGESNTELIFGKVDGVVRQDGIDYLMINDERYEVSTVTGVLEDDVAEGSIEEKILQSAALIGTTITAKMTDESGQINEVTGQVEKITIQDGAVFVVVDGQNIPLSSVEEIAA